MYTASKTAKKQSCVKLIEYQKVYLLYNLVILLMLKWFTVYKPIGSTVHKTVHKFSARNTNNMFALFGTYFRYFRYSKNQISNTDIFEISIFVDYIDIRNS
jgi:hypothetical protein